MSNPSTIRGQAKIFKETDSVKIEKSTDDNVLTLDEIGERLEHTPKNFYNVYHRKLEYLCRLYTEQQNY